LGEWVDGTFVPFAEAIGDGGHTSVSEGDARKGAGTNGLKKAAAMFGVGRQAYEGSLDDDQRPEPRPERAAPDRTRLSPRQLHAIRSLASKHGLDAITLRDRVRRDYGVVPESLSSEQASRLITELTARAA
jgi:hypothetical protein